MSRIDPTAPGENGSAHTRQTFLYFGSLTLFLYLATPTGFLVDIQTSYMLKNHLHATATQISMFRLVTAVPVYFAFASGLMRDLWNPFGLRDRGYFLIFAPANTVIFILLAFSHLAYLGLLIGMFMAMLSSRFIAAAYQGLMALLGQEKLMSGRLSVLWNIVSSVPLIAGAFASGYISDHLAPKSTFFLVAGFVCCIGLLGCWNPRSVFSHTYEKPQAMSFVRENRTLTIRFLKSYIEGIALYLENPAVGKKVISNYRKVKDPRLVEFDYYNLRPLLLKNPITEIEPVVTALKLMGVTNREDQATIYRDAVDNTLIKAVRDNKF